MQSMPNTPPVDVGTFDRAVAFALLAAACTTGWVVMGDPIDASRAAGFRPTETDPSIHPLQRAGNVARTSASRAGTMQTLLCHCDT